MARESIYSALMDIKDVLAENGWSGGGSGEGSGSGSGHNEGSGSGCECSIVIPRFNVTVTHDENAGPENEEYTIEADYTPNQFEELFQAGRINWCKYYFYEKRGNDVIEQYHEFINKINRNVGVEYEDYDLDPTNFEAFDVLSIVPSSGSGLYSIAADFDNNTWLLIEDK